MKLCGLKTDYQVNPAGIDLKDLTFQWKVEDAAGSRAACSRFLLSEDPDFAQTIFDSDRDDAGRKGILPAFCYEPAVHVEPGKTYYWKVAVKDDTGDTAESDVQTFEGGHPDGGWTGEWITPAFAREIHPVLRKEFTLTQEELADLQGARLYICGLGLYEAYLNGKKVGDQFLTPYFTDYRFWVQYQTFDVTPLLHAGVNQLDVWLGDGWYKGRFGYMHGGQLREYFGGRFRMIADLYLNGVERTRVIGSDESWHSILSPVISSGIYDGEVFDARMLTALKKTGQADLRPVRRTAPSQGTLSPMTGVPVCARERRKPVRLIHTPKGEQVLDFGQEVTGWVEFCAEVPSDTRVILDFGEVLQDGCFYRDNLRTATAQFTYISDGSRREGIRPHFTYFGFRYVRVSGLRLTEEMSGDFTAVSLYSNLEETGYIATGNEEVNQLISNTKWSEKDNFLDIPTDCPQRDERAGWTGDAQIFSDTASYHMETPAFFRKYLKDMLFEQRTKGGAVPFVVPDILTLGREKEAGPEPDVSQNAWGEAGSTVWGDAATVIPWTMYVHSGNRKWLREAYPNMCAWVDFIRRMDEQYCGGKRLWTCGFHFGDWLSLDAVQADGSDNREGGTDKYFVASVYYMYSARLTAKAASVLGRKKDDDKYSRLADEVLAALRRQYVTGPGRLSINTQTAYVLGICSGLFETEPERQLAGDHLAELLHAWNDHLATGFVGTRLICDALTETGHVREAFTLLLNTDYPGWLYEVRLGATTIWERWNSLLPDGKISGTGMNSLNHYAYGAVCGWIYRSVCGISVTEDGPGGTRVHITPHTDVRLGSAKAEVKTAAGIYTSGWKLKHGGQRVTYTFSIPFGGEAEFVPDLPLENVTINGETSSDPAGKVFGKGTYLIQADIKGA